jgi:hypothetical protein
MHKNFPSPSGTWNKGGETKKPKMKPGRRDEFAANGEWHPSQQAGVPRRFTGRWLASFWRGSSIVQITDPICSRIAEGYEDEHGFHYGRAPAPRTRG